MTALTSALEITKLAHEMHVDEAELSFLATTSPDDLRDLRGIVSHAMFSRHESRVKGLAAVRKKLPAAVTAKITEIAKGPMLSARVAGSASFANVDARNVGAVGINNCGSFGFKPTGSEFTVNDLGVVSGEDAVPPHVVRGSGRGACGTAPTP